LGRVRFKVVIAFLQQDLRGNNFNAEAGRRAKILGIERHYTPHLRGYRQFQHHVVVGIRQTWPPQEVDCLKIGQRAQSVKHKVYLDAAQVQ
jgi:hypothetical protein